MSGLHLVFAQLLLLCFYCHCLAQNTNLTERQNKSVSAARWFQFESGYE